jgi:hypothetical protein
LPKAPQVVMGRAAPPFVQPIDISGPEPTGGVPAVGTSDATAVSVGTSSSSRRSSMMVGSAAAAAAAERAAVAVVATASPTSSQR